MRKAIPQAVKEIANGFGYNSINYLRKKNGIEYYSFGLKDKNDFHLPIGLPVIVALNSKGETKIYDKQTGLTLLHSLNLKDEE